MPIVGGVIKPLNRGATVDSKHMQHWYGQRCSSASLTTVGVPIIGRMYVHKKAAEAFVGVLAEIEAAGIGHLIDLKDYRASGGTYNCRLTRGSNLWSPHAWGVAVDINVFHKARRDGTEYYADTTNFKCASWEVAPSLKTLAQHFNRWGFAWGGHFNSYLDPMHFEATEITLKILSDGGPAGPDVARLVVRLPGDQNVAAPIFRAGKHYLSVRDVARLFGRRLVDHRERDGKLYLALPTDNDIWGTGGTGAARLVVLLPGHENVATPLFENGTHYLAVQDVARLFGVTVVDHVAHDGKLYLTD